MFSFNLKMRMVAVAAGIYLLCELHLFSFQLLDIVQAAADAPSSEKCKVCLPGEAGETPGDRFLVAEHY